MLNKSCHKKAQIPSIPDTQFVGTSCRRYFCRCQLSPPINEYTYCVLKRICRKIVKEICNERRQEVYSVFDGGNSIGYESLKQRHRDCSFLKYLSRKSTANSQQQIVNHRRKSDNVMGKSKIKKRHEKNVLRESGTSMSIEVNLRGKDRKSNRKQLPPEEFVDKIEKKRFDIDETGKLDSNNHGHHIAKLRLSTNNKTANMFKANKLIRKSRELIEIQSDQVLKNKHEEGKSLQVLGNSKKQNSQNKSELNQRVQNELPKNQENQKADNFIINSSKRVERYERSVYRKNEQEPTNAKNTNINRKKQPDQVSKHDYKKKKFEQIVENIEAKRSDLRPVPESTRLKKLKLQSNPMQTEFATKKKLRQQTSKMLVIPTVEKSSMVKRKPAVISRIDAVKASDYLRAYMEYKDICFLRNYPSCNVSNSQCAHLCPNIPNSNPRTCVQCTC